MKAVGITCGVGSMLIGARAAGFEVVGNVEWRKYYSVPDERGRTTFGENYPGAVYRDNLERMTEEEFERFSNADIALGHPECIPGPTKVYTSKGWKKIKKIVPGDLVMTHTGKFRQVVRWIEKQVGVGDEIVSLSTTKSSTSVGVLRITPDHPILRGDQWVKAGEIQVGDRIKVLAVKCKRCEELTPVWNEGKFCSVSCAVDDQWEKATLEERELLTKKAHSFTRQIVKSGGHPFQQRETRLAASRANSRKGRHQNGEEGTSIERKMSRSLKDLGLSVVQQYKIGRFFVDFAIPELKIAIECDGDYWHQDPDREKARDDFLREEGWTVLHFREAAINRSVTECAEEVYRVSLNHSGRYEFTEVTVRFIERRKQKRQQKVYNLSVLDDNSYIAKGFVVKNCGNFSQLSGANSNRKEKLFDPADIPLFVEIVAKLKPRFFVMDDLPRSFMAYPMAKYAEKLFDYDLFPEWVSNYHYGNVQRGRKRMFMLGALRSERWAFVPGEAEHQLTVADVIGDLGKPRRGSNVPNHDPFDLELDCFRALNLGGYREKASWEEVQEYFRDKPGGFTLEYERVDGSMVKRIGFLKGHWSGPSHVLTGGNAVLHHQRCEPYTIRERARIQGFPDDFVFYGTVLNERGEWNHDLNPHMVKQTGKAMPIQFCTYVSKQVAAHIQGQPFETTGQRVLPPNEHVDEAKQWYCASVGYSDQAKACGQCWLYRSCSIRAEKYGIGTAPEPKMTGKKKLLTVSDAPAEDEPLEDQLVGTELEGSMDSKKPPSHKKGGAKNVSPRPRREFTPSRTYATVETKPMSFRGGKR